MFELSSSTLVGLTASIFALCGYVFYWQSILVHKTKPSRMTWVILFGLSFIIAVTNWRMGVLNTSFTLIINVVGSFITLLFAFFYFGDGGWERNDKIAFVGLLITLVFWLFTSNDLMSLLFALLFDFWGLLPTLLKLANKPDSEEVLPWLITVVGAGLNLFAIVTWNFYMSLTPLYMFALNAVILVLILKPKINFALKKFISNLSH